MSLFSLVDPAKLYEMMSTAASTSTNASAAYEARCAGHGFEDVADYVTHVDRKHGNSKAFANASAIC